MPPLLVVYRYGSVVFAGSREEHDLALTDTYVPLAVRYKAGGDNDSTMTWRDLLVNIPTTADPLMTWRDPAETLRVVVDPAARESAAKGTDMVLLQVLDVGGVRVLTSVLAQSAALKLYERRFQQEQQWARPLFGLLLVAPGVQVLQQLVVNQVPALFQSVTWRQYKDQKRDQAGFKFYLASALALVATLLLVAHVPAVAHSLPIFGITTTVLCMQDRVEATADKVVVRVLGTVLGATLGLAILEIPSALQQPAVLLTAVGLAAVALSSLARAGSRTALMLALFTLCAVAMCAYEGQCRGNYQGAVSTYITRLTAVSSWTKLL
eukprot:gene5899-6139_t